MRLTTVAETVNLLSNVHGLALTVPIRRTVYAEHLPYKWWI